jgi:hypothetical protein
MRAKRPTRGEARRNAPSDETAARLAQGVSVSALIQAQPAPTSHPEFPVETHANPRKKRARRPANANPQQPKKRRRRQGGGRYGLSIVVAGAMVGMSRSAAFRAANAGKIPTIGDGRNRIVPRLIWERMLGIRTAPQAALDNLEEIDPVA